MTDHPSIRAVSDGQLRAWADAGVISSARFVDEMSRRSEERRQVIEPPPLDYDLGADLDIPLEPYEIALPGWPEIAIAGDDERLPAAARPMWETLEWAVLGIATLGGCVLLALVGYMLWGAP